MFFMQGYECYDLSVDVNISNNYKWFLWVYCMFGESEIPETYKSSQKNTFETKKKSQSFKLDSQL